MRKTLVKHPTHRDSAVWRSRPDFWFREKMPWWFWVGVFLLAGYWWLFQGHNQREAMPFFFSLVTTLVIGSLHLLLVPRTIEIDDFRITFRSGRRSDFIGWKTVQEVRLARFLRWDGSELLVETSTTRRIPLLGLTTLERRAVLREAQVRLDRFRSADRQ